MKAILAKSAYDSDTPHSRSTTRKHSAAMCSGSLEFLGSDSTAATSISMSYDWHWITFDMRANSGILSYML